MKLSVASTLAAVFTLAAPWAFGDALAAHAPEQTKAPAASEAPAKPGKAASASKKAQPKKVASKEAPSKHASSKHVSDKRAKTAKPAKHEEARDHEEPTTTPAKHVESKEGSVVLAKHDASEPGKTSGHEKTKPAKHDVKPAKHDVKPAKHDAKPSKDGGATKPAKVSSQEKPATHAAKHETKPAAKPDAKKADKPTKGSKRASARLPGGKRKGSKKAEAESERPPCFAPPISIDRNGLESESFSLVDCKGTVLADAREKLSVLARPWGTPRPELPSHKKAKHPELRAGKGKKKDEKSDKKEELAEAEIAPNVRLLDPGLLSRVESISKHFGNKGISLVSGYRPKSKGSLHQSARALDMRVAGASNEELVAFCKTLPDTGCGYYPNSSFVHVDVRAPGTGSVTWIDASGPGETPRYVAQWPPPPEPTNPDASGTGAQESQSDADMTKSKTPADAPADKKDAPSQAEKAPNASKVPAVEKEADPKEKGDSGSCTPVKETSAQSAKEPAKEPAKAEAATPAKDKAAPGPEAKSPATPSR